MGGGASSNRRSHSCLPATTPDDPTSTIPVPGSRVRVVTGAASQPPSLVFQEGTFVGGVQYVASVVMSPAPSNGQLTGARVGRLGARVAWALTHIMSPPELPVVVLDFNASPSGPGLVTVTPAQGTELTTEFTFTVTGFSDVDTPRCVPACHPGRTGRACLTRRFRPVLQCHSPVSTCIPHPVLGCVIPPT